MPYKRSVRVHSTTTHAIRNRNRIFLLFSLSCLFGLPRGLTCVFSYQFKCVDSFRHEIPVTSEISQSSVQLISRLLSTQIMTCNTDEAVLQVLAGQKCTNALLSPKFTLFGLHNSLQHKYDVFDVQRAAHIPHIHGIMSLKVYAHTVQVHDLLITRFVPLSRSLTETAYSTWCESTNKIKEKRDLEKYDES